MTDQTVTRAEARRIRRGRQPSVQQGQGHGNRRYVPVTSTNKLAGHGPYDGRRSNR